MIIRNVMLVQKLTVTRLAMIHQKLEMIVPVPVATDESASVDAGDPSIPMPNSFKPSPRSSFKVSNIPLSKGHAMTT
jgi:hypothetical protein